MYFFSFTVTPPTQIYTLSLHDALPISYDSAHDQRVTATVYVPKRFAAPHPAVILVAGSGGHKDTDYLDDRRVDRKSTRLNSSHVAISYAVFCLKKKKRKYKKTN